MSKGLTTFEPGVKPTVAIDLKLHSGGREHRYRTTLAHEWGHVTLHNSPFQAKCANTSPFARAFQRSLVEVSPVYTILGARDTDWMEWQAGYVCGALLMPEKLYVLASFKSYCDRYRCHGRIVEGTGYPVQITITSLRNSKFLSKLPWCAFKQLRLIQPKPSSIRHL